MNRYLHSIFCDDIRHEVGGKISYIGAYSGRLFVPSFPVIVPKLCIAIIAVTPAKEPFKKFTIKILKDDEKILEQEMNSEQLTQSASAVVEQSNKGKFNKIQVLNFLFQFTPFLIDANFALRIRADTDGEELQAPGLVIDQSPTTE